MKEIKAFLPIFTFICCEKFTGNELGVCFGGRGSAGQVHPMRTSEHAQKVCRLFKQAINTSRDWVLPNRRLLRVYIMAIRRAFDRRKDISDERELASLVDATENLLNHWKHETPYVCKKA